MIHRYIAILDQMLQSTIICNSGINIPQYSVWISLLISSGSILSMFGKCRKIKLI